MWLRGSDIQSISFLFGSEYTSQVRLLNLNSELIGNSCEFNVIDGAKDQVGNFAFESFKLLIINELTKVNQLILVGVDNMIEDLAWVL